MNVYIAYGWPEGNWHGNKLKAALLRAGYQITKSATRADIVIAHSAGCYMLPETLNAKLILLIGIPNWPNRSVFKSASYKVRLEPKDRNWFAKTYGHFIYGLFQPRRLYTLVTTYKKKNLTALRAGKIVVIHNEQDTYMSDEKSGELAAQNKWIYQDLNGQHDDLWQNPASYIKIIKDFS